MERSENGFFQDLAVRLRSKIRVGCCRLLERMGGTSDAVERTVLNGRSKAPSEHNVTTPAGRPAEARQPELDLSDDSREAVPRSWIADPVIVTSEDIVTGDDLYFKLGPIEVRSVQLDKARDGSGQAITNSVRRDMVAGVFCGVITSTAAHELAHTQDIATLLVGGGTAMAFAFVGLVWNVVRFVSLRRSR
jgi:hypothetical protein